MIPQASQDSLRRATALISDGRPKDAIDAIKALGPAAGSWPPLVVARASAQMVVDDYIFPDDGIEWYLDSLRGHGDWWARYREFLIELECLKGQSDAGDFRYRISPVPAEKEYDELVTNFGVPADDPGRPQLRGFLELHPKATMAALRAARARPICGQVRVSSDGSGDASTITEGLHLLERWGGRGTLLIGPGQYFESIVVSGRRIVLRAAHPGESAVQAPAGRVGLAIVNSQEVVVDGLVVGAVGAPAIDIRRSDGVTIKRSSFISDRGQAESQDNSPDVSILDCQSARADDNP